MPCGVSGWLDIVPATEPGRAVITTEGKQIDMGRQAGGQTGGWADRQI